MESRSIRWGGWKTPACIGTNYSTAFGGQGMIRSHGNQLGTLTGFKLFMFFTSSIPRSLHCWKTGFEDLESRGGILLPPEETENDKVTFVNI
jgi:hypothetical protein